MNLNPALTPEDRKLIDEVLFNESSDTQFITHSISLSKVLEVNNLTEQEFMDRLSDPKLVVLNAMSNIDKAEKAVDKAREKYEKSKNDLDDDSIDYGKRANNFFTSQSQLNQAIDLLNVQTAHAFYVVSNVSQYLTTVDEHVTEKLSDISDKF